MNLISVIETLLLEHDCVIIPNFGGIIGNETSAKYNELNHTFYPPSKQLSFNQKLTQNDGLLANTLVQLYKKTYTEAIEIISKEALNWKEQLKKEQHLPFGNIGVFHINSNQSIVFEPTNKLNFLKSSYGLFPVSLIPVEKEKITPVVPITSPEKRRSKVVWAAAVLPIAALLGYSYLYFTGKVEPLNVGYAGIGKFWNERVYENRMSIEESISFEEAKSFKDIASENESAETIAYSFVEDAQPLIIKLNEAEANKSAIADNTNVHSKNKSFRFHVIGGCFSVFENAEKMVEELKQAGYNASIIGKHKDLYAVSYNSFTTREEALEELFKVKSNHNQKAWLLNK